MLPTRPAPTKGQTMAEQQRHPVVSGCMSTSVNSSSSSIIISSLSASCSLSGTLVRPRCCGCCWCFMTWAYAGLDFACRRASACHVGSVKAHAKGDSFHFCSRVMCVWAAVDKAAFLVRVSGPSWVSDTLVALAAAVGLLPSNSKAPGPTAAIVDEATVEELVVLLKDVDAPTLGRRWDMVVNLTDRI